MSEFPVAAGWPLTGKQPIQRTHFHITNGTGTEQWTLPNGNMFNKAGPMCVCFSDPNRQPRAANSKDPQPGMGPGEDPADDPFPSFDNVLLGPLRWDFPGDAVLIAREEIELEWSGDDGTPRTVVADHWNKGPHHFHYDVQTNQMVRQWQAEVALTLQTHYVLGSPDPVNLEVDKSCYSGLFHLNLSCIAPPPVPPPQDA